jgi:hypothetical protein
VSDSDVVRIDKLDDGMYSEVRYYTGGSQEWIKRTDNELRLLKGKV